MIFLSLLLSLVKAFRSRALSTSSSRFFINDVGLRAQHRTTTIHFRPNHIRFIKRDFRLQAAVAAQIHQNFVFDTLRGISGQLDSLFGIECVYCLDQPDCQSKPNLRYDSRVIKLAGDINDQAQVRSIKTPLTV